MYLIHLIVLLSKYKNGLFQVDDKESCWKFSQELDDLLCINSKTCIDLLYSSGLKSLGKNVLLTNCN